MNSGDLLAMLNRAIKEKEAAHESYAKYYQQMNNPSLRKIVEGVLQREEQHLEILGSMRESLNNNVNLEEISVLSAERLMQNTKNHEQQIELLKMTMKEIGGIQFDEDRIEAAVREDEGIEFSADQVQSNPVSNRRKSSPTGRYSSARNRSVVSCSFNTPRTIKKR